MEPIECRGPAQAMGRQYGEARATELARELDDFFTLMALFPARADRARLTASARRLLAPATACDPEAVDFVRGQAEGAGLPFEELFCLHCLLEVMFTTAAPMPPAAMCTSFALTGPATRGGRTIAGQNVDWFTCCNADLLHLTREDGSRALALCLSGVPFYQLSSRGLCNCANLTLGPVPAEPAVPIGIYLQRAMRQPTLDRALAVIRKAASGLGAFFLADASGAVLGVESIPGRLEVLTPENGVLVHANHYETEAFRPLDQGLAFMPDSPPRAARMRELVLARHGRITPEDMLEVLGDHHGGPHGICRHPHPDVPPAMASESRASFLALPAEGVMWVCAGPPCVGTFSEHAV
jgi:isopenicillin-N N-acyltransferase-like protein